MNCFPFDLRGVKSESDNNIFLRLKSSFETSKKRERERKQKQFSLKNFDDENDR